MRSSIRVVSLALALCAVDAPARVWAGDEPGPVSLLDAAIDLNQLAGGLTDPDAINDRIIQYLDLIPSAYVNARRPAAPAEDASEDDKAAYRDQRARFDVLLADYRKRAEALLFKAFQLQRVRKRTNQRDVVNRRAAQAIGALAKAYPVPEETRARERLSRLLRGAIVKLQDIPYDLNTDVLDAAFQALGRLGTRETLTWLREEFTHIRKRDEDWLVAAHRAMVLFPATQEAAAAAGRAVVLGLARRAIVEKFVVTYMGVAWRANLSSTQVNPGRKRSFWRNIRWTTIAVLQHFARHPKNPATGKPLARLHEFRAWFAGHRDIGEPVWAD